MKHEAFSYEEFLKGRKVFTVDGAEVTQLMKFDVANDYCLAGVVGDGVENWTIDGKYSINTETYLDLVLEKKEKKSYMILYDGGFESLEIAIQKAGFLPKGILEVTHGEEITAKVVHTFNK